MLHSFTWMNLDSNYQLFFDIYNQVTELERYFYKFNRLNAEEAMSRTIVHVLTHYEPKANKDLRPYIKKLAREIMKDGNRDIPVDFLEQTVAEDDDQEEQTLVHSQHKVSDFSDEIISEVVHSKGHLKEVVALALTSMKWFNILGENLENGAGIGASYFSVPFKHACLRMVRQYPTFVSDCLEIYHQYGASMAEFLEYEKNRPVNWNEANSSIEFTRRYKRGALYTLSGNPIVNHDLQDFRFVGVLPQGQRVYRVWFNKILNSLLDLLYSEESNPIKFVINDQYVVRTIGGSSSVINPSLETESGLFKSELLTNMIAESSGRFLSVGSESAIIVVPSELCIRQGRTYCGVNLDFVYEDITDTLMS